MYVLFLSTMVEQSRESYLSLCPERFFKVFLPDKSSHRMKFPSAFLQHFDATVPFKSTIITPTKISWKVHVEKIGGYLCFNKGWEQFVQHNSLEFGDFLVFSYGGGTIFHVKIYGRNGCEKESTNHSEATCHALSLLEENQIVEKSNSKVLDYVAISETFEEGNRDFKEASLFKSDFPFFKVVMKPSYITCAYMNIPASFVWSFMKKCEQDATLLSSDKSWPVRVIRYRFGTCRFACGWGSFVRDNALKEGDSCMFELVDKKDYVFYVSIFRSSN